MLEIGKQRIDGKYNVWKMRHGQWSVVAVCLDEAEANAFIENRKAR